MIDFIDSFMQPPIQFLSMIIKYLTNAALVAGKGIRLSDYLSWVGLLGPAWVKVLNSLLASFGLLFVLWVAKQAYGLYLAFKSGIKWW